MAETRRALERLLRALTGGQLPPRDPTSARQNIATEKRVRHWLKHGSIQGFGIGRKMTAGKVTQRLALRVYVDRKRPIAALGKRAVRPSVKVPWASTPVLTDVIEIGTMRLHTNGGKVRPAIPGYGIGVGDRYGTLGCVVKCKGAEGLYLLTSGHVIAVNGVAGMGTAIMQPAARDGGTLPADRLGRLQASVPIDFAPTGYPNRCDAAIAHFDSPVNATPDIRILGRPTGVSQLIVEGMGIQKTGYTTDCTHGVVQDAHFVLAIAYPTATGGTRRVGFRDMVLCSHYADAGDSGAAILNVRRELVGLHFSGSESASVFCRISYVFSALGLELG